jgi:hypothetical protein
MALTDKLRAAVFARDKGICAFSGLSLWILDQGTPIWNHDWPDHIKPVSRGGKDTLDNLVCASFFYNRKKLNSGGDTSYFFREGRPTEQFFWVHGELTEEQGERLSRYRSLQESDWYFNRALSDLLIALNREWFSPDQIFVRKAEYWRRAAHKKLRTWRGKVGATDADSFIRRGLVRYPDAADIRLMLLLADADDAQVGDIYERLKIYYDANAKCLDEFSRASGMAGRRSALLKAERDPSTTEPLLALLRRNAERLADL